ncbi:MAG: hypothetical protein ABGX16_12980 [Pirellulales bacterium]
MNELPTNSENTQEAVPVNWDQGENATHFQLPKPIARKIGRLRMLVRLYVMLDSVAVLLLLLGVAFWLGLATDWLLEPTRALRIVMWGAVLTASLWITVQLLFRRLFARLPRSGIALVLERQFPQLQESLVTTVDAAERIKGERLIHRDLSDQRYKSASDAAYGRLPSTSVSPAMLQHTSRIAAERLARVPLRHVLKIKPLVWKGMAAACMVLTVAGFAAAYHQTFDFWLQRLQLGDAPWPRRVQLKVHGFELLEDGQRAVKLARDDDYVLHAEASILEGHSLPGVVEIRYRLADGRRGRDTMTRVGEALPGRDQAQRYRYQFKHVAADLSFEVLAGDDRIQDLHLKVVERPQIVGLSVEIKSPAYLQREPNLLEVSGRLELPEGASANCRIVVSKPLQFVRIDSADDPENLATLSFDQEKLRQWQPGEFHFQLDDVREDRVLLITMRDQDGIENRDPFRLMAAVLHDEVPEVSTQLQGIGSAVTAQATLPFSGTITDDYGIEQVWFEFRLDRQKAHQREMPLPHPGSRQFRKFESIDLSETDPANQRPLLQLKPGQKLSVSIRARDAYNLTDQPHLGSSQQYLLDVVTPSELRALLEKRELGFRQRFEAIYEKLTASRDLLDRIEGGEATTNGETSANPKGESKTTEGPLTTPVSASEERRTISDDSANTNAASARRLHEVNRLRVMSLLQNATQLAYETLGVADGFETIVAELINNRVDTQELTHRLQQQITMPLKSIGQTQLPALEGQLQKLQAALEEPAFPKSLLRETRQQTDAVLLAMQAVLDRMLELESYNEIVELLRGIIAEQERLNEETKSQQRTRLRSLLED